MKYNMKRKKLEIKKLIFIIIVIIAIIAIYYSMIGKYIFQFRANWSITIPKGDKIIFERKKEPSFNGDGEQYLILEYNNSRKLQKIKESIEWNENKNVDLEKEIIELLDYMKVPNETYPNFDEEYLYYYDKESDFTRIYLINIDKKIYIIEQLT